MLPDPKREMYNEVMEEKFEEKVFEYRMKSLIELRTALMQLLTVLVGGVIGLCFVENSKLKFFLITAGLAFVAIFVKSFISTIRELNKIIYRKTEKR